MIDKFSQDGCGKDEKLTMHAQHIFTAKAVVES